MADRAELGGGKIVGIDLGTTFSLVAVVEQERPRILADRGERLLPSVVGFSGRGELLVGTPARNQYVLEPNNTVRSIKRKMGSSERVTLAGRQYTPQEISAFILRKLAATAERELRQPVQKAVITVPARFGDAARQATKDAGEIAGLEVVRIINEPTAAALAYGLNREEDQFVAVYDLGGGTFDVSIVELSRGVIEVRASHGNPKLGGDDFDELIVQRVADDFRREHAIDLRHDRRALARLVRAAEKAKIELSDHPYARIVEEHIAQKGRLALHLDHELSRDQLEKMIGKLVRSTLDSVDFALKDAGLKARDLSKVLLVGGSTRIPLVRRLLAEHLDVEPRSEVHPDEAVALGAAIQAAIIAGEPIEAVLVDVAPYSLGIETVQFIRDFIVPDRYSVLIPRNTAIPCSRAESYYTLTPEQDQARIRVYQGEDPAASKNTLLGEFVFSGLSPAPDGRNREVVVQFDYDVNGIVQVSAIDRRTQRQKGITITASRQRLSEGEKAAAKETLAALDRPLEREIDAVLRRAEKLIARPEDLAEAGAADRLSGLAAELERARQRRDYGEARRLVEELTELMYAAEK